MLCFPNAKINIGLNITEKRSDGFHNIETIFYPIPLTDGLELCRSSSSKQYEFSSSGIPINITHSDNIVCKAFDLVRSKFQLPPSSIHLHKNIPFGAGLGGGSSDAAFLIKMINELYHLNIPTNEMEAIAGQLGSDCPFFIKNKPVFAKGKGDVFSEITFSLNGYYILLIKPDIQVSTPEAYAHVIPKKSDADLTSLIRKPISQWKDSIFNDFEKSIFQVYPELATIKKELYQIGAEYASMSGSGSSLYGIFKEQPSPSQKLNGYFHWSSKLE